MRVNYYGFDHKAVNKKFTGGLTFLNTFCLEGESTPFAVYSVKSPDRKKGHKEYLLLMFNSSGGLVRGLSKSQMQKHRKQSAIKCKSCNELVFSVHRHDFRECSCGKSFADGGKDYLKCGGDAEPIVYDLLTDKEVKINGSRKR